MVPPSLTELIARYSIKSLVLANAVWLYFLISGATTVHDGATHKTISIGPLIVNYLDRIPMADGAYTLHLTFASGLLWLELIGIVVGCLAAIVHIYLIKHNQKDNTRV